MVPTDQRGHRTRQDKRRRTVLVDLYLGELVLLRARAQARQRRRHHLHRCEGGVDEVRSGIGQAREEEVLSLSISLCRGPACLGVVDPAGEERLRLPAAAVAVPKIVPGPIRLLLVSVL